MNIKPLSDRVLIQPIKAEEITASGIVLPDTADKKEKAEGIIVAAGPGKMLDSGERSPMEVNIGDRVMFEKWGAEDVEHNGEDYKIVSADKIIAIIE